jgi:hypothetical protein
MKKIILAVMCLLMFTGCAAFNASTTGQIAGKISNVTIDVSFVYELQTHPEMKGNVVTALNNLKLFLNATSCTYDDLIIEIAKQFPQKYAVYAVVISYYFDCDTPNSTSFIPMLDPYKASLNVKIDRLLKLTELIK